MKVTMAHENQNKGAVEYWKSEKCECLLCKDIGGYNYDIPDTHAEMNGTHRFPDLYDFERGATLF